MDKREMTVAIVVILAIMIVLGSIVASGTFSAHNNNLKDREHMQQCYAHGGTWDSGDREEESECQR